MTKFLSYRKVLIPIISQFLALRYNTQEATMKILLVLALCTAAAADGYKILCIMSVPSKSHNHLAQGIVNALLKADHEVTWLTPFPPKGPLHKGLKIIDGSATIPISAAIDMTDRRNANKGLSFVREFARNISVATANIPALRAALVNEQFDAVVTETFFSDVDAGYAAVQQAPWIMLSGVVLQPMLEAQVDDVRTLGTIPMLMNDFPIPMSFWQRVVNVGIYIMITFGSWWEQGATVALYHSMFGPLATARGLILPPLEDALNNVSILFVNSHSSFAPAQSLPPNVVEIGGYHIEETTQPLPKDLQELLDSSSKGVIYFSMGSVIQSSKLPAHTKKALLTTLGELPYTVLWKFEEQLEGLPKNVHIRPWMPQAAILAHKHTVLFITHGGLLSTLEALQYGVPLVAVPVFGDQPANAARAARSGYAVTVRYDTDTMARELKGAVEEVLSTDKYSKQAKYLSSLFNKRPVTPSKLISHYVELAVESKGAYHLRSKSKLYPWYQRWLVDQLAVLITLLFAIYTITKKAFGFILSKITGSKKTAVKKVKRN